MFFLFTGTALSGSPRVVFVSPTADQEHPFWKNYILFMGAAARDLDIDLEVVTATDRYAMMEAVERVVSSADKPDYLVTLFLKGAGPKVLDLAQHHNVPVFLVNTEVQPEDMNVIGYPRKRYSCWLGDMCYDDRQGGRDLAEALLAAARTDCAGAPPAGVVALTGTLDNSASIERIRGLKRAMKDADCVTMERELNCYWERDVAYRKMSHMIRLAQDVRVVWAASDAMALGAVKAMEETGRKVGQDVFVGGFDWTMEGLNAIEQGRLVASAGGHFMEGAWMLVLLHDHFKGKDFAPMGLEYRIPMQLMDKGNVEKGKRLLNPDGWDAIDFRCFSRVYNGRADYDFGVDSVIDCTAGTR